MDVSTLTHLLQSAIQQAVEEALTQKVIPSEPGGWVTDPAALETIIKLGEVRAGDEVKLRPPYVPPGSGYRDLSDRHRIFVVDRFEDPERDHDAMACIYLRHKNQTPGDFVDVCGYNDIVAWRRPVRRKKK